MKFKYVVAIIIAVATVALYALMPFSSAVSSVSHDADEQPIISEIQQNESSISTAMVDTNTAYEQCNDFLLVFEPTFRWQQNKKQALKDVLSDLAPQVNRKQVFQAILAISGIGHYNADRLLSAQFEYKKYKLWPTTQFKPYLPDQISQLQRIFKKNNVELIINALIEEEFPLHGWYYDRAEHVAYPLLSLVLSIASQQFDDDELYLLIRRLIDSGVAVDLADLAYATRLHMSLDILALLRGGYTGEVDKIFTYSARLQNLATLAVNYNHVDALKYWLAEGVNAEIFFYKDNALDILNQQIAKGSNADKEAIFIVLANHGVSPNNISTNKKVRAWLSAPLQKQYESILVTDFTHFSLQEKQTIAQAITKINDVMSTNNGMLFDLDINKIPSSCLLQTMQSLMQNVFAATSTDMTQKKKLPLDKTSESKEVDYDLLLETLLAQNLSPDEVVAGLGRNKDIASKNAVGMYLSPISTYMSDSESFNLDEPAETDQLMVELQLEKAIYLRDIPTALTLLSQGVTTKPSLALLAIHNTNLTVLKAMYANGNDLNYTNSKGQNSLYLAALLEKMDMVEYLLSIKVNVKPSEFGHDPLDIMLGLLDENPSCRTLIETIIDAGAPIEKSHKESMQGLKILNPQMYIDLTDKYPQLIL